MSWEYLQEESSKEAPALGENSLVTVQTSPTVLAYTNSWTKAFVFCSIWRNREIKERIGNGIVGNAFIRSCVCGSQKNVNYVHRQSLTINAKTPFPCLFQLQ